MNYITNKELADVLVKDSLIRTVKHYGLEGAIEAIHRVYCTPNTAKIKAVMLRNFKEMYNI